jgi:hypothetical protein
MLSSNINVNANYNKGMLFQKSSGGKPAGEGRVKSEKKFGLSGESTIVCVNCGNAVTMPEFIISVDGEHTHSFTNTDGFAYEIDCFSFAEGCVNIGELTSEETWFEGFDWSLCICSNCHMHLGWFYQSEKESFFGLIQDLLSDSTFA